MLFMVTIVACKKDDPPVMTKSMNTYELELIGQWDHVKTIVFTSTWDTSLVIIPNCGSPYLEFKSTVSSDPDKYELYYNQDCLNQNMNWYRVAPVQMYINDNVHTIELITADSLVLIPSNSNYTKHYYTK